MTEKPTFSICIPNYNYGHYIGETLESVLNQDYPHFEILIADNASTDDSIKVIETFQDTRIRLIKNSYNIGFAPNLQQATRFSEMDYINLLSSDDLMLPGALSRYAEILESKGGKASETVLFSDTLLVDKNGKVFGYQTNNIKTFERKHYKYPDFDSSKLPQYGEVIEYDPKTVLLNTLIRLKSFGQFLTIIYPRNLWEKLEGYNVVRTVGPDKMFNYKLLSVASSVVYLRQELYKYRLHGSPNEQAQKASIKQQIDDYLNTLEFSEGFLKDLGTTRNQLIQYYLDNVCLKTGLTQLVYGTYRHAVRMWGVCVATFPGIAIRRPRFYILSVLLALGPLGRLVAKILYYFKHEDEKL